MKNLLTNIAAICACVTIGACSDPAVAKRKYLEQADALARQGQYREAVLQYRNAIKLDPKFGEARYKLATAYEQLQDGQQASKEFFRAADLMPERADVQLKAAAVALAKEDFESARKYAEVALKARSDMVGAQAVDAQILLAYALAGLKDIDGAVRQLQDAIVNAPDDSRPYSTLGALKAGNGNSVEAEQAFRKAVEIDSRSVNAKTTLAYYLLTTKRGPEAEQVLKQALELDRSNSAANRLLALHYLTTNRTADAETPLLRLVNAKDAGATLTLADLYVRTGRSNLARPLYESLKDQNASRTAAIMRLASIDYNEQQRDRAYAVIDAELKESPANGLLLALKARWLVQDRRIDEALDVAKKAVTASPQLPAAQYALGLAESVHGNPDAAINAFNEALKLDPQMALASAQLSRLFLARGDADSALKHAQAARTMQPANPDVRFDVARALLAKGDVSGAEAELKALQADLPRSGPVHMLYGQVLLARSDDAGAAREFDKALELTPSDVDALTGRIKIDLRMKRPQDARSRIEAALTQEPKNGALLILAGRLESTLSNPGAAETYFQRAIDADPGNLTGYNLLSQVYVSQNRLEDGRKELEKIVARRPDSVAVRTMIGMIQELQGRQDESIKTYESIVKSTSRAPVAANNLAYLYAERGEQLDMAVQLAQNAKQLLPDDAAVSDTLGWVYYKHGMVDLAIRPLEFSARKDPKNPAYHFHLGLAYAKADRPDRARQALELALQLNPNFRGADEARTTLASLKH